LGNQAGGTFTNNTGYGNYQIGGGMANQSAFFLDGVPLNTSYINSPGLVPTQDAIQEFRVDTNAVSAEFGRFAGGVVNMASKSGTDQYHGTAYEYIRNKVLNANTYFNNRNAVPNPPYQQNQYGVTFGGPIRQKKLFGFFSWENYSFRKGNPTLTTVPSTPFYTGDFSSLCPSYDSNGVCNSTSGTQLYDPSTTCGISGAPACPSGRTPGRLPFAGNMIPSSRIDPATKQYWTYFGKPNLTGPGTVTAQGWPINNFAGNTKLGGNTSQYTGRLDWVASDNQRVFARYTYWGGTSMPSDPFGTHFGGLLSNTGAQNFVIGDTITINPRTIADFRLSYLRSTNGFTPEQLGADISKFGPAWAALAPQLTLNIPPDVLTSGFYDYGFLAVQNRSFVNDYALSGSLIKILGRHTLKFGGEVRFNNWDFIQTNNAGGGFNFNQFFTSQITPSASFVNQTGYSGASFFLGDAINQGYPGSTLTGGAYTDGTQWYSGLYLQDTYQVNRKLTLTAGLRWELPLAFTEKNNRMTVLLPNAVDPLSQQVSLPLKGQLALVGSPAYPDHHLIQTHYNLFSPRVNAAYSLNPNTSIRAGYGISWIPPDMINYQLSPFQSPVNAATTTMVTSVGGTNSVYPAATFGNPFPNGLVPTIGHNPSQLSVFEGQSIASPIPNEHYGYAQQWDLDVQQQLAEDLMLEVTYAGAKGTHLSFASASLNALPDSDLSMGSALNTQMPNPFYGHITNGLLSSPTISKLQLLRPYPQFTGFSDWAAQRGDSHWNALETRIVKRFRTGGMIMASYTWSKLISNTDTLTNWLEDHSVAGVQDWNNLRAEKSLASFDVPNRFVASYILDLPFGANKSFFGTAGPVMNRVIGGWSFEGITILQSGFPLGMTTYQGFDNNNGGIRPNVVAGQNKKLSGSAQSRLNEWFNTKAFADPAPYTFGNESRLDNTLRNSGVANWDIAVSKKTPLSEKLTFDFKTEMFNAFNRTQFGDPSTNTDGGSFGRVSSTVGNPRLIQFSARFSF
jgi:outer membrane receptor protein involved in Fe transport